MLSSSATSPSPPLLLPQPLATAPTTTPANTHTQVQVQPDGSVMLYWPASNAFIAVTEKEWAEIAQKGQEHIDVIVKLHGANKAVSDAAIVLHTLQKDKTSAVADLQKQEQILATALNTLLAATEAVKTKLAPLAPLEADGEKLLEMLPLSKKEFKPDKPIYIPSSALKSALQEGRIYLVDGEAEKTTRETEKLFKNGKLDLKEIKKRMAQKVQDSASFKGKIWEWPSDADQGTGQIFENWSKRMGAKATTFLERTAKDLANKHLQPDVHDPNNPYRNIDLKPEAQLLRWTAGAGIDAEYNPFQGNLFDRRDKKLKDRAIRGLKSGNVSMQGEAHASLVLAEAKIPAQYYYPHFAGWHASPTVLGQPFDLGYYRFLAEFELKGAAGVSLAVELDIGVTYAAGKQGLRGTRRGKGAKVKAGGNGELNVFAGASAGLGFNGSFQWLNPEGLTDLNALSQLKAGEAIAEYCDVAKALSGAAIQGGAGVNGALTIRHFEGKFVIRIKAGLCIGVGGEGELAFEVGTDTIKAFFKYVAYTLKHADWQKMGDFIQQEAFVAYNQILVMVVAKVGQIEQFANKTSDLIKDEYDKFTAKFKQNKDAALDAIFDTLKNWGLIAYLPPESRGALLALVAGEGALDQTAAEREKAAYLVAELMHTQQTPRQMEETLQHMTVQITEKVNVAVSEAALQRLTDGTLYANVLLQTRTLLANAKPMLGKPFLRNDEPTFVAALFPVHDKTYLV